MSSTPDPVDELTSLLARAQPTLSDDLDGRLMARLREHLDSQDESVAELGSDEEPGAAPAAPGWRRGGVLAVATGALVALIALIVLIRKVGSNQPEDRVTATRAPAVDPLAKDPASPPPLPSLKRAYDLDAAREYARILLRNSLREVEPSARIAAIDAIARLRDQASISRLLALTERDPDAEVRAHAAEALGEIGAPDAKPTAALLRRLESTAAPALKVWYASALVRLGDARAMKRLATYARDREPAVAVKASFSLAALSQPGDQHAVTAIRALEALAANEAKLNEVMPYAGALILTKMAALRDANARKILYALLKSTDEGTQLAAAEGLATLGDDAGSEILQSVAGEPGSPNQLVAAVAQIKLGNYDGFELIHAKLDDRDAAIKRLATRALGQIGSSADVPKLIALAERDQDWTVRIAAASAALSIIDRAPAMLVQASEDWTSRALASADVSVRRAAARLLGEMPDERRAVPLLAQAIVDRDARVRLAASSSAGKMRSQEAALQVIASVRLETSKEVREQQLLSLGRIGHSVAKELLAELMQQPDRPGVVAAGSLLALGDSTGRPRLLEAVQAASEELRLVAVRAASEAAAANPIAIPILIIGVRDSAFAVRFAAAEALSRFDAERAAVVAVLAEALGSRDVMLAARAQAGLLRLGVQPEEGKGRTPQAMLASPDPQERLAALLVIAEMPDEQSLPLLRLVLKDPNQEVRHAGVETIERVADRKTALALYRDLADDADAVVRTRAAWQLARRIAGDTPAAAVPGP